MTSLPASVLYFGVAVALLLAWRRLVQPMSKIALVVLLLLPLCFTGRAIVTGRVYAPIDLPFMSEPLRDYRLDYGITRVHNGMLSDLYAQMMPWQHAVRTSLARGEWPVWNPYLLCGSILAANMQAAPYDAVNLIGLVLEHPQALTFAAAIAFFLAGLFTFAFARELELGEPAALIAAAAFMFHAGLAFAIGWPIGRTWVFLPLVMLAVRRVAIAPSLRSAALLTIAFVLTILAGHPETLLHVVAIGGAYGAFLVLPLRKGALRPALHAAAAGAIALCVSAISLLPFLAVMPQTVEYDFRHNVYATTPLHWTKEIVLLRAARTFLPYVGGQPERDSHNALWEPPHARVGTIVFGLALLAPFVARRRETWFFTGLALITLCAAFDAPPIAPLLHKLPMFDIALNNRLGFGAAFALAILAAMAVERRARFVSAGVLLGIAIAFALVTWMLWKPMIDGGIDRELMVALTTAELVPLVIAALVLPWGRTGRPPSWIVLGLVLLQRTLVDGAMYPSMPERMFYPDIPILRAMQKDESTFRMIGAYFALVPDTAALYELEDARGYEAMTFERLAETFPLWCQAQPVSFNLVTDLTRPFLSFLNIKYAITSAGAPVPEDWRLVLRDRDSQLIENTRVLPRAFVPRHVRYERSGPDTLLRMAAITDFADQAVITIHDFAPHDIVNGPGRLVTKRKGTEYEIDADMENDGWVILSDSMWPGWRYYIDGKRLEPHWANHAFVGVFVTKGKHKLRVAYVPEAFTRGRNVTLATLIGLALFFALRHRFQKPRAVRV